LAEHDISLRSGQFAPLTDSPCHGIELREKTTENVFNLAPGSKTTIQVDDFRHGPSTMFTQVCTFHPRSLIFRKQPKVTQHIAVTKGWSAAL
jgi:hypothetical protein